MMMMMMEMMILFVFAHHTFVQHNEWILCANFIICLEILNRISDNCIAAHFRSDTATHTLKQTEPRTMNVSLFDGKIRNKKQQKKTLIFLCRITLMRLRLSELVESLFYLFRNRLARALCLRVSVWACRKFDSEQKTMCSLRRLFAASVSVSWADATQQKSQRNEFVKSSIAIACLRWQRLQTALTNVMMFRRWRWRLWCAPCGNTICHSGVHSSAYK